jgi:16S rRNA (guanine966-N2)-methyltransferase
MRVTGGTFLGRTLKAPAGSSTRPTSDRVREALFNILSHHDWGEEVGNPLDGAIVLDAFGGTAALAIESLSRGAKKAFVFDKDRNALKAAFANVESLGLGDTCIVKQADALRPYPAPQPCSLIFIDPPYRKDLVVPSIQAIAKAGWIAKNALLVIETSKGETSAPLPEITLLYDRTYGDTSLYFARYQAEAIQSPQ